MKAIVYREYGSPDVLRFEDLEKPTAGDGDVLIRVRAASVNPLDYHLMHGAPYVIRKVMGLRAGQVMRPGRDVAGQVEEVGANVTLFNPGDAVFGSCRGAFAEYACSAESSLALKPGNVTFEQAAAAPVAALSALQGLRDKARVQPGQKVLINGAAGGVGTFAVQIAKAFGAEVTGVCSTGNVGMVRSIGADRVIDYSRDDFTRGEQRYDVIFDLVANHPLLAFRRVLNPGGKYIGVGVGPGRPSIAGLLGGFLGMLVLSRLGSRRLLMFMAKSTKEDLLAIREMLEAGTITPVIDRCYGLPELPDAIRYVEKGHARGKVVITVG